MTRAGSGGLVGVVVVGHGRLAADMVDALESIVGRLEGVEGIATHPDERSDEILARVADASRRVDVGRGVLILTDFLGDTASNVSVQLARAGSGVEVVTGVNMPMLVKLAGAWRGEMVGDLARKLREYGRDHILWVTRPAERVA